MHIFRFNNDTRGVMEFLVTSVMERCSKDTHCLQITNKLCRFYFTMMTLKSATALVPSLECTKCVSVADVRPLDAHNPSLPAGIYVVETLSNSNFILCNVKIFMCPVLHDAEYRKVCGLIYCSICMVSYSK